VAVGDGPKLAHGRVRLGRIHQVLAILHRSHSHAQQDDAAVDATRSTVELIIAMSSSRREGSTVQMSRRIGDSALVLGLLTIGTSSG
jgi:hypothetical protein